VDPYTKNNIAFGAWIQPSTQIFMWVLGSRHPKTILFLVPGSNHRHNFFCGSVDPCTNNNIAFGAWIQPPAGIFQWAWIQAPKSVLLLVPGTSYPAKYFYGCLNLGTENHFVFSAWIQTPAGILPQVRGSGDQKQYPCSNISAGEWIRTPTIILQIPA
jgi:hypothetical protein